MPKSSPEGDRRVLLAEWMTSGENPWFARNWANRIWAHFASKGLVMPVDDFRATNPPSNPELLNALADHLVKNNFDLRELIRLITSSNVYQLSSKPNPTNELDEQNYSRTLLQQMDAEVLLDAICQVTGIGEKFQFTPAGYRAIELWDSSVNHYFLRLFGRPVRQSACECERITEPGIAQVLHLMNSSRINNKLGHEGGAVLRLEREVLDNAQLVEEMYLRFLSRFPGEEEEKIILEMLDNLKPDERKNAVVDVAWSLMNSLEFILNH